LIVRDAALLEIEGLTVSLPPGGDRQHAVKDISLALGHNEIVCVVGESGSGKSVMARSILRLFGQSALRTAAGSIRLSGEDLVTATDARMRQVRGREISMIFQEPMTALNPLMTIGRQIEEMVSVHGTLGAKGRRELVMKALADVRLPNPDRIHDAYPHEMSGGQRQRAMIAMALAMNPKVLIADEPTTALDVTTQSQILALIKEIQAREKMGILFITHDFGVVAQIADRVAVMNKGELVEFGLAAEVLNSPQQAYTRDLIAAVPRLSRKPARPLAPGSMEILRTTDLQKSFGGGLSVFRRNKRIVHAVKSVNVGVHRGRTLAIVGESGSGKSTLARCIARFLVPDAGRIVFDGIDITALSRSSMRPHRKRIQFVFQDPYASLNPRQRVVDLIAAGPLIHGETPAKARKLAFEMLDLVGLNPAAADRYPHEFSGGQRQRIGIARALALRPDVLIADEAVSALDVSIQKQILALLQDVRDRFNLTMLFITHDLRVASQISDDILVMRQGEVVEVGATADVFANPKHAYTQELLRTIPDFLR
jgi:peptide/nickel transport system ATP-binding protein